MELRTEIEIEAPAPRVWSVLCDLPSYPEWNPFISAITGDLTPGSRLDVLLTPPGGREFRIRPTVLRCERDAELRWRGQLFMRGLFDGEHFFRLTPLGENRTRFLHGENFTGVLVRPLTGLLTNTARGFVFMNQALKR